MFSREAKSRPFIVSADSNLTRHVGAEPDKRHERILLAALSRRRLTATSNSMSLRHRSLLAILVLNPARIREIGKQKKIRVTGEAPSVRICGSSMGN